MFTRRSICCLDALLLIATLAGCGTPHADSNGPTNTPTSASAEVVATCGQLADFSLRCSPDTSCQTQAVRGVCLRFRPDIVAAMGRCLASADCSNNGSLDCPEAETLSRSPTPAFATAMRTICQRCPAIGATETTPLPNADECTASLMGDRSPLTVLRRFSDESVTAVAQCASQAEGDATSCPGSVVGCLRSSLPELNALSSCPR